MSVKRPLSPPPLPPRLVMIASLIIGFHVAAVAIHVLSAQSGPWPTRFGASRALGPAFAFQIANVTTRYYLQPLVMTHDYHFPSNRPDIPMISFEVRLRDADGHLIETLRFPNPKDNIWLYQRHSQLAQNLAEDERAPVPQSEEIPAPGKKPATMKIWDQISPRESIYRDKEVNLIPKTAPVFQPTEWSLIVARAYMRHLSRQYGAASVELSRHRREPVMPGFLFVQEPEGTFDTFISNFEEYRREK